MNIALSKSLYFSLYAENPTLQYLRFFAAVAEKDGKGKLRNYLRRAGALPLAAYTVRHIALAKTLRYRSNPYQRRKNYRHTALDGDMRETGRLDSGCLNHVAPCTAAIKKIRKAPLIDRVDRNGIILTWKILILYCILST